MRKSDESKGRHFRTGSRFFCADGQWFYTTREGDEGPFRTRREAEEGLQRFMGAQKILDYGKINKVAPHLSAKNRVDRTIWDKQVEI